MHELDLQNRCPRWMKFTLRAAAVYNLVWGTLVILFPLYPFEFVGMQPPRYPELWQCIGMIVGVYGVGYWIAAADPMRHWPIVLVGLLGKIFGPIGFLMAATRGSLPWMAGWTIVTNDLIWWLPFAGILWQAARAHASIKRDERELKVRLPDASAQLDSLNS